MIEWTLIQTTFEKGDGYIPLYNVRCLKEAFKCTQPIYARPLVGHACSLVPLFYDAFLSLSALTGRNWLLPGRVRLACQRLNSGDSSPGNPLFPGNTRLRVDSCKRFLTHSRTCSTFKLMHASYMRFFVLEKIANAFQYTINIFNLQLKEFMPYTHQNQQCAFSENAQTLSLQIMHSSPDYLSKHLHKSVCLALSCKRPCNN